MEITAEQLQRLTGAYAEIGAVLEELGALDSTVAPPPEPQWMKDTAKQWALLNALASEHNGDLGKDDWSRLGRQYGYDPRGLGGFFVGSQPLMASQGVRRVLTGHGRKFIERWRGDFGPPATSG